jgi:hypothetical protein
MFCIPSARLSVFSFTRGKTAHLGPYVLGVCRLPADPVGIHTLTLTNVVVGSRVFIQDQDKTVTHYDQIAAASTVVIPLEIYGIGSPLNDWLIKVRKASSGTTYIPYETLMTATLGSSSIYVSQIPDE